MSEETKDAQESVETPEETQDVPKTEVVVEVKDAPEVADEVQIGAEEKMAGIKESAANEQALAEKPEDKAEVKEEGKKEVSLPSFFVQPDERVKVDVDILFEKDTGRILSVSKKGLLSDEDFESNYVYLGHTVETFTFTQPTYDDLTTYRQKSAMFRREINRVVVDTLQMRNFLIVWHLKDWTIRSSNNEKIELSFDPNGSLTDEAIKIVYGVAPAILDVVLSIYEKDIILS